MNFAREEIKEAMPYIQERTYIKRNSPDDVPLIYTTGIGGSQFLREIREIFNVEYASVFFFITFEGYSSTHTKILNLFSKANMF